MYKDFLWISLQDHNLRLEPFQFHLSFLGIMIQSNIQVWAKELEPIALEVDLFWLKQFRWNVPNKL